MEKVKIFSYTQTATARSSGNCLLRSYINLYENAHDFAPQASCMKSLVNTKA